MFTPRTRAILLGGSVLAGAAVGAWVARRSFAAYSAERVEVESREANLRATRSERIGLEREAARTRSEVGREEAARRQGYARPGERDLPAPR